MCRFRDALGRYGGVTDLHVLPDDRQTLDAVLLAGRSLADHAPQTPVRRAVADLHALPDDRSSLDAVLLAGRTLAESAPEAPVRRAIAALAQRVRTELGAVPVAPAPGGPRERVPEPAH